VSCERCRPSKSEVPAAGARVCFACAGGAAGIHTTCRSPGQQCLYSPCFRPICPIRAAARIDTAARPIAERLRYQLQVQWHLTRVVERFSSLPPAARRTAHAGCCMLDAGPRLIWPCSAPPLVLFTGMHRDSLSLETLAIRCTVEDGRLSGCHLAFWGVHRV
jgi:hypothetical protein